MAQFVLVHGAFHGGWCWSRVAERLRAAGHAVLTPTQTGLGERRHLLSAAITLDTFVDDICGVLEAEEVQDAVLVGHSFGGISITGVADRMPERVRHLVYLDSRILEAGQSMQDVDAERSGTWRRMAEASGGLAIPPPPASYFDCPDPADAAWIARRLTPHPLGTFTTPLNLANPVLGNGRPCTYVACTDPVYPWLEASRQWARGREGWGWAEIAAGHDAMVSAPAELAELLVRIAGTD
ncbi:MAG: alpha/beta fold hydrolase [Janthinobacterium lividum]